MSRKTTHMLRPLLVFSWLDWWRTAIRVVSGVGERNLFLAAGGMAFFATLSIFPTITLLISSYAYFSDPSELVRQAGQLEAVMPPSAYELVYGQVHRALQTPQADFGVAGLISIALILWAARAGSNALLQGLTLVFSDVGKRSFLRHTMTAILLTITIIGVVIFTALVVIAVPIALQFLPLGGGTETFARALTYLIGLCAMMIAIGILYRYGPNRRGNRIPLLSFGGLVAGLLWLLASILFSYYLKNFGNYNEVYGSIGAVAALMMWFFVSSFVVLFGALLNFEIERQPLFSKTLKLADDPLGSEDSEQSAEILHGS